MPAAYRLELGEVEQTTLEEMSKHHPKAYMRERAAAVLKVAHGLSIRQVAAVGVGNGSEVGEGLRAGRATGVVSARGARA